MTDRLGNNRDENTVSDAEWTRVLGEALENVAEAKISGEQGKADNLGAANGTGDAEGDYEVGYGKPPKHTRFKKGHSGNRKGRPKGTKNLKTDLVEELSEIVAATENGRKMNVSKQRLMTAKGIKGDTRAASILINLVAQSVGLDPGSDKAPNLSAEDAAILEEFMRRETEPGDG